MKSSWVGLAGKLNSSRGSWELYPHQRRSGVAPSYQRLSRDPASSAPAQGDGLRAPCIPRPTRTKSPKPREDVGGQLELVLPCFPGTAPPH